jgi:hypothetical protein
MHVIPAQAGIQSMKNFPRKRDETFVFARFAECVFLLDTGLRRYDGLMSNQVLSLRLRHPSLTVNKPCLKS